MRPCLGPRSSAGGVVRSREGTIPGGDFLGGSPELDDWRERIIQKSFHSRDGASATRSKRRRLHCSSSASEHVQGTFRLATTLIPTCSPSPVLNPPHATARRAPPTPRVSGSVTWIGCPFLFTFSTPPSKAREATRNAPRGSGFRQHDTYAREDAAPTDREPSARRKHTRERVSAGTHLGFFLPSSLGAFFFGGCIL